MRVLLTGGSGFVGQYVSRKLKADGIDLVTMGRATLNQDSPHIYADLLEPVDYPKLFRDQNVTHLIHLAWYAEHGKYWSSPLNMEWIKSTASLVSAFCQHGGKHITVSGTCAEYDWSHGYCTEEVTPTNPKTIYGISKDATRRICQNICSDFDVPIAWGRVFFPYGKGESKSRLLPSLAEVFQETKAAFGVNGNCYRDFLHVSDVASALVTLSTTQASGCINISSSEAVPISDVVTFMAKMMAADSGKVLGLNSPRTGEPNLLVGNNARLRATGWQQNVKLIDGLKDFYEFKEQK
jgi:nucleoside-diphosphate-sugar epimerase